MSKQRLLRIVAFLFIVTLLGVASVSKTNAIIPRQSTSWFWANDTNIRAISVGDVNGDNKTETVTVGTYFDGLQYNAQLIVWNSSNFVAENIKSWFWINDSEISSVGIGDVNGDGQKEIVTAGAYFNGTFWNSQLIVWNGSSLVAEGIKSWFWVNDTQISSVALGDVNGDNQTEIVTGGTYNDGTRANSQLIVWNGSSLVAEGIKGWFWVNDTEISSVALGDVNGDNQTEIVTGGTYNDGTRANSQLIVWNGSSLVAEGIKSWFWVNDTQISSVALGDVNGDNQTEIVTGGTYNDGTRANSQLIVWNGSSLVAEGIRSWFTTSSTGISSVAIGDVDASNSTEVVTCGQYFDNINYNAELEILNGTSLALKDYYGWISISTTVANSVVINNLDTLTSHIITGGQYSDLTRFNAQLRLWG